MKMKKQNIFTTIAAASLILGQAGQLSVFAQESTPVQSPNESQENNQVLTEEEKLQLVIEKAQELEAEAKKGLDEVTPAYESAKASYDTANGIYQGKVNARNDAQIAANNALIAQLEEQMANLENTQGLIKTGEEDKKELEEQLATVETDLAKAQETLAQKEQALKEAQENAGSVSLPEQIEQAQQAVTEAQNQVKTLAEQLANLKNEYTTVHANLETAKQEVAQYAQQVETTKTALATANETYANALAKVEQAQAVYDATIDPEAQKEAQAALDQAKAELANAQQAVVSAQTKVTEAEEEVAYAETKLNTLETNLANKNAEIAKVEAQLGDSDAAYQETLKELEAVKAEHADLVEDVREAQAKVTKAEEEVAYAEAQVNGLLFEQRQLNQKISAQEKTVADLKEQAENMEAQIQKGSLGFFESMGYEDAVEIINEGIHKHGSTNLGDPDDATSLENMKATLEFIKECNALRQQNGLNELLVSGQLMAIAQVQANHTSNALGGSGHSHLYNVGENLAYGRPSTGYNPFDGWYTREKAVVEWLDAHNMTWDDIKNDTELKTQIAEELGGWNNGFYGPEWVQVGHYENIVNSNYLGTGFAINSNIGDAVMGQVFEVKRGEYSNGLMSVDDFFAAFDEYYSNLMGAQGRYEEAQAQLDALKAELEGKISDLERANADLTTAKGNYTQAQNGVTEAENAVTENETAQKELQDKLDSILNGEANAALKAELEKLQGEKADIESQITTAKGDIETAKGVLTTAQETLYSKQEAVKEAEANVAEKQAILDSIGLDSAEALKALNIAKADAEVALNAQKDAQKAYDSAVLSHKDASDKVSSLTTALTEKESAIGTKEKEVANAEKTLADAEERLAILESSESLVEALKKEIAQIKTEIANLETFKETAPTQIKTINDKLAELAVQMKEERTLVSQIEAVKANYDALIKDPSMNLKDVESKHEIIATLNGLVKALQSAYADEVAAKESLAPIQADYESKRSVYLAAKAKYDEAKANTQKAMDALQAYLDSQKQPTVPSEEESTSTTSETTKEEGVNTAVATGTSMAVAGMIAGLAGFGRLLRSRKEESSK